MFSDIQELVKPVLAYVTASGIIIPAIAIFVGAKLAMKVLKIAITIGVVGLSIYMAMSSGLL